MPPQSASESRWTSTGPVARLAHIVTSKAALGREKDRLFLAAHAEALRDLLPP